MATYDLATQTVDPSVLVTGDIINCSYCGAGKSITLPKGTYKLEVWGAQGGGASYHGTTGGKGGYSVGTLTVASNKLLYLYSGGQGNGTADYRAVAGG